MGRHGISSGCIDVVDEFIHATRRGRATYDKTRVFPVANAFTWVNMQLLASARVLYVTCFCFYLNKDYFKLGFWKEVLANRFTN